MCSLYNHIVFKGFYEQAETVKKLQTFCAATIIKSLTRSCWSWFSWLPALFFPSHFRLQKKRSPSRFWPSCPSKSPSTLNRGIYRPPTRRRSEPPRLQAQPLYHSYNLLVNGKPCRMRVYITSAVNKNEL